MDDQELKQAIEQLSQLIDRMAQDKSGPDSPEFKKVQKDLDNLRRSLTGSTKATKDNTESTKDATTASGAMAKGLGKVTTGTVAYAAKLAAAASDMRENRENFTSLNSSIELTGNAVSMVGKTAGMAVDAIGDMASSIPVVGSVVGGVISGFGKLTAAMAEAAGNIINTVGPMLTAELQRASEAYRAAGAVGALGAEGMSGLGRQAVQAGLSFSTFSKVAADGAEGLAFAFGDSATGVQRFADASQAMQPFRRGLLAMGVSAEQQNELTAKYLALEARRGNIEGRNARDLAQGSRNYIKQLTTLSRITGMSVDEAQKAMDEQMRNVRLAAAVAEVQATAGKEAADAMSGTALAITKIDPNIGKGLQDALAGNLGTEAAQQFQLASGEMGAQAVELLRNGKVSQEEAIAMISQGVERQAEAIGGPRTIGAIAGLGTAFDAVLPGMLAFKQRANLSAEELAKLGTAQEKLATTTDGVTNNMIDANESMLKAATALDDLALQTTLPLAAKGIEVFTGGIEAATRKLLEFSGMSAEEIAAKLKKDTIGDRETVERGDIALGTGAGALGGMAAGAVTGAVIGSVIPVVGTVIGGAIGAGIGGLAGAFSGFFASREGVGQNVVDFDDDSWWGGLFNKNPDVPKRAVGGPVKSGQSYLVGEKGPELLLSGIDGMVMPNDQLLQLTNANDQLTKMSNMAGPASSYNSADYGGAVSANLPERTQTADQSTTNTANSPNNTLMEASINRLDQLVSAMSRNNDINTKILQAAHR
jgi:hypothetical protein